MKSDEIEINTPVVSLDEMAQIANNLIPALEKAKAARWARGTWDEPGFREIRKGGPYMMVGDQNARYGTVDMRTGLPSMAWIGLDQGERTDDRCRWSLIAMRRLDKLPKGITPSGNGHPYEMCFTFYFKDGWVNLQWFVTISAKGKGHSCRYQHVAKNSIIRRRGIRGIERSSVRSQQTLSYGDWFVEMQKMEGKPVGKGDELGKMATLSLNIWKNREFCWNAVFSGSKAKVVFGFDIYEAKKIFRDRTDRLTKTGRKRPIIHWVSSHYRKKPLRVLLKDFFKQWRLWLHPWELWVDLARPSTVRTFIRGSSDFMVNAYEVSIFQDGSNLLSDTWAMHLSKDEDGEGKTFNEIIRDSHYYKVGNG